MDAIDQVEENAAAGSLETTLTQEELRLLDEETAKLKGAFCRRCDYCQPCPQSIDISTIFLLDGYLTRYGLPNWAKERYRSLPVAGAECTDCGACEEKCPYQLPIRQMLKEAGQRLS
jgi:predicted aldo/keto reductase-like oxidoreductase